MCIVDADMATSKNNASNSQEVDKNLPRKIHIFRMAKPACGSSTSVFLSVWKGNNYSFFLPDVYSLRLLSYRHLLQRLANHTPYTTYNKSIETQTGCMFGVISSELTQSTWFPSFTVSLSIYLSFLHSFSATRQVFKTKPCCMWQFWWLEIPRFRSHRLRSFFAS